ncbi:hypothetical protein TgHK011_004446 [Trichoderma gracile]|nr:hypothetical protein TgHK011_004446 [Trichoderma gracile]
MLLRCTNNHSVLPNVAVSSAPTPRQSFVHIAAVRSAKPPPSGVADRICASKSIFYCMRLQEGVRGRPDDGGGGEEGRREEGTIRTSERTKKQTVSPIHTFHSFRKPPSASAQTTFRRSGGRAVDSRQTARSISLSHVPSPCQTLGTRHDHSAQMGQHVLQRAAGAWTPPPASDGIIQYSKGDL